MLSTFASEDNPSASAGAIGTWGPTVPKTRLLEARYPGPAQVMGQGKAQPQHVEGALPGPMDHLGDKADLTPSPLRVSGSHRGGLTGETNDVVRCYVFALTEQASVILLMPRRNHCSPGVLRGFRPSLVAERAGEAEEKPQHPGNRCGRSNGAERNRTAVRNIGVDHLVGPKTDLGSMALPSWRRSSQGRWA